MEFRNHFGDTVRMMSAPVAGYRDVYSFDDDNRSSPVERFWGFWSKTDRDGEVLFFDTPDDETYDLKNYAVMYETDQYHGIFL